MDVIFSVPPAAMVTTKHGFDHFFADLLTAVGNVDGIRRVRFTSPHPKDMRPETFVAMAQSPAVCEHLHYPLQSGSDRVLALMHRGYTADRYLERLADARRHIPDLAVSTDIIVGFPGETEADFEQTLEVTAAAGYDFAYTFIFSPRPGTEAADLEASSLTRLSQVSVLSAFEPLLNGRRYNATRLVLAWWKKCSSRGLRRKIPRCFAGRTSQNKLVHFTPPTPLGQGRMQRLRITGAPHHLLATSLSSSPNRRIGVESRWKRSEHLAATSCCHRLDGIGKSSVAMAVAAERDDTDIISVDSMQVYRHMSIGTAKPTVEEQQSVRHHLIDIVEPSEEFTVAIFQHHLEQALSLNRYVISFRPSGRWYRSVPSSRNRWS